jgi:hypothetical protein
MAMICVFPSSSILLYRVTGSSFSTSFAAIAIHAAGLMLVLSISCLCACLPACLPAWPTTTTVLQEVAVTEAAANFFLGMMNTVTSSAAAPPPQALLMLPANPVRRNKANCIT